MKVAAKDRQACIDRCNALMPAQEALTCAMESYDCHELESCPPVY